MRPAYLALVLSTLVAVGLLLWSARHEGADGDRVWMIGMILNAINVALLALLNLRSWQKND